MLARTDAARASRTLLEKTFVRRLYLRGVRADHLTAAGLGLALLCGALAPAWPLAAGVALLGAGALDMLDGALARSTGEASPAGALLDAAADRYGEFAVLFGAWGRLALLGLGAWGAALALLALQGSWVVKETRARTGFSGHPWSTTLFERSDRLLVLALALFASFWETALGLGRGGAVAAGLAVLAVGTNVSALVGILRAPRRATR
ncbi:MAG: CDP-alcohol phosphatidyltransferase family protein [Deltaproteobacteria bacterium]|nr:CDP-alcohol phosphatidyltransferase family protein [Deltaproteobacteria bacterium]